MGALEGKVAIVTGAASGFGRAIAELYAAEGARVVLADIDATRGAEVTEALNRAANDPRAAFVRCDVTVAADVEAMFVAAERAFSGVDILVNNAGWTHRNRPLLEVSEAEFDRVYAINVKSIYLATIAGVPRLAARGGGVILNTASTAGLRPRPGLTWYNGSKGAVVILTKSMAAELAAQKIRVNALCPVMGETGLLSEFMGVEDTPENRARFIGGIPLGRLSKPSDVAEAALFLASDRAEFLTGVCLEIDGGRCI